MTEALLGEADLFKEQLLKMHEVTASSPEARQAEERYGRTAQPTKKTDEYGAMTKGTPNGSTVPRPTNETV